MGRSARFVCHNPITPEELGIPEADDQVLARLRADNPGTMLHKMDGYVFDHEGHTQMCRLPEGHRFVVIVGGLAPLMLGDEEPGDYVFSAPPEPEGGGWPQLLMVVENVHLRAVMNMDGAATMEMVRIIAAHETGQPPPSN